MVASTSPTSPETSFKPSAPSSLPERLFGSDLSGSDPLAVAKVAVCRSSRASRQHEAGPRHTGVAFEQLRLVEEPKGIQLSVKNAKGGGFV